MKRFGTLAILAFLALAFIACGGSTQPQGTVSDFRSPNPRYAGFDLTRSEVITVYNFSGVEAPDRPEVIELANSRYFRPILNTEFDLQIMPAVNLAQMYPLLLAGGEDIDLIFTATWRYYEQESRKGSFHEVTPEFAQRWMPNVWALQDPMSWEQARIDGRVYGVPNSWNTWEHKFTMVREELRLKHNLPPITNWDTLEQYVFTIAREESELLVYNTAATTWELMNVYLQNRDILLTPQPTYFAWHHRGPMPTADELVFLYASQWYRDYAVAMSRWFTAGAFGMNVMNQTITVADQFRQGRSATMFWHNFMFDIGDTMQNNGFGTASFWEISPNAVVRRRPFDSNLWAFPSFSNKMERAALVLDLAKTTDDIGNLFIYGIEGRHHVRPTPTTYAQGPDVLRYPIDHWTGAFHFEGMLRLAFPPGSPQDRIDLIADLDRRVVDIDMDAFRIDMAPMASEWAVIAALVAEWNPSFLCGIFGAQTDARIDEFVGRLRAAGLDRMTAMVRQQYTDFRARIGR